MTGLDAPLTADDIDAFVTQLVAFDAAELDDRERALLRAIVVNAMDPLDRRRLFGDGFTADQLSVLERLEATRSPAAEAGDTGAPA